MITVLLTALPAQALESSSLTIAAPIALAQEKQTDTGSGQNVVESDVFTAVGEKRGILEARARSAATVAHAAEERKTIIDFQKIVLPIDRVDGGSYTNQTPFVTWVKGERSDQVYPVPPGVTYPWAIDGFADPIHRPGHVYKVIDGLHMYYELVEGKPAIDFTADGGLRFVPGYTVAQSLKGGWRDESWHEEIRSQTDYGWDKLFEVSRLNLSPIL